jgi:hypothetical protein
MSLDSFWVLITKAYPNTGAKALRVLMQFSTSCLCELGFSALANIKTKKREELSQSIIKYEYAHPKLFQILTKYVNVTNSVFHIKCFLN